MTKITALLLGLTLYGFKFTTYASAAVVQITDASTAADLNGDINTGTDLTGDDEFAPDSQSQLFSENNGVYSVMADSASFMTTFTQTRDGTLNSQVLGQTIIDFTATSALSYTISGSYSNGSGSTQFTAKLIDTTSTPTTVFFSQQETLGNVTFNLGGASGNSHVLVGSLTGTLVAEHSYEWLVEGLSQAVPADGGANPSGSASLTLDSLPPDATAPEPASLAVWSVLGLSFAAAKWRRRRSNGQCPPADPADIPAAAL